MVIIHALRIYINTEKCVIWIYVTHQGNNAQEFLIIINQVNYFILFEATINNAVPFKLCFFGHMMSTIIRWYLIKRSDIIVYIICKDHIFMHLIYILFFVGAFLAQNCEKNDLIKKFFVAAIDPSHL